MEISNVSLAEGNVTSTSGPGLFEGTLALTTLASELHEATESSAIGNGFGITHSDSDWSFHPITWSLWVILQMVSAIIGILGNGLVMMVLFQRRAKSRSTDTLVGGLAAADFLTSIFMISVPKVERLPATWLGEVYCKIQEPNIPKDICVIASIYILVAISTERYIAIVHPIYFNRILTRGRVAMVIIIIWLFAILATFPRIFTTSIGDRGMCLYRYANRVSQITVAVYLFCLRLLVPTIVLLVTQIFIARHLYIKARQFQGQHSTSFHDVARQRVLKMMLIVIITYVICWGPVQVTIFLFFFGVLPQTFRRGATFTLLIVLSFFNSCVNPIIYALRFREFRGAVWSMFRKQERSTSAIFEQDIAGANERDSAAGATTDGMSLSNLDSASHNPSGIARALDVTNLRQQ